MFHNKEIIYINSNNKITGSHSNFFINLTIPQEKNFTHVALLSANIPKSYYSVVTDNNTFQLREGANLFTVTITIANYNWKSFKTELTSKLNLAGAFTYSITFPSSTVPDTSKYTFSVTGNVGVQPQFIFSSNNISTLMGFNASTTYIFSADSLISANVINLQKEDTIYIHSNICQNQTNNNILEAIYGNSSEYFSNITYYNNNVAGTSKKITSNNSSVYSFFLSDENNNEINLNGINCNLTLILYREYEIIPLLYDFLKFQLLNSV